MNSWYQSVKRPVKRLLYTFRLILQIFFKLIEDIHFFFLKQKEILNNQ